MNKERYRTMKKATPDKTVVVIGMSRRVYAKTCKKQTTVESFASRIAEKENWKARQHDNMKVIGMTDCVQHGDLYEYRLIYAPRDTNSRYV